jgi:tripartite-type tricarboxylate transporter receptor subunit TctC
MPGFQFSSMVHTPMNGRSRSLVIFFAMAALVADFAAAQSYPNRPIRMLVPFPPGAATDTSARMLAGRFSETLGQQVIVDNRTGASGIIATSLLARAAPDGHTLMTVDVAHGANPVLNDKLPYDTLKDISAVSLILRVPMLLLVNPGFPAQSVKDLIAVAKANPGKYNYGSAGTGSTMYLIAELFKTQAGVDLVHVAYKGGAPALTDVMGGQIPMCFLSTVASLPQVKAGRVRALGISGRSRSPVAPEIPTIAESGVPGFEFYLWQAMIVPSGTPQPIMTRLNSEVKAGAGPPAKQGAARQPRRRAHAQHAATSRRAHPGGTGTVEENIQAVVPFRRRRSPECIWNAATCSPRALLSHLLARRPLRLLCV